MKVCFKSLCVPFFFFLLVGSVAYGMYELPSEEAEVEARRQADEVLRRYDYEIRYCQSMEASPAAVCEFLTDHRGGCCSSTFAPHPERDRIKKLLDLYVSLHGTDIQEQRRTAIAATRGLGPLYLPRREVARMIIREFKLMVSMRDDRETLEPASLILTRALAPVWQEFLDDFEAVFKGRIKEGRMSASEIPKRWWRTGGSVATLTRRLGDGKFARSLLHDVADCGEDRAEVVEELLLRGADPDAVDSRYGCTPFSLALMRGAVGTLYAMLYTPDGAKQNEHCTKRPISFEQKETPLHYAAGANREVAELLLDYGVDIDERQVVKKWFGKKENKDAPNALWYAVRAGREDIVRLLLDRRCDYDAFDGYRQQLMAMARETDRPDIEEMLCPHRYDAIEDVASPEYVYLEAGEGACQGDYGHSFHGLL